MDIFEREKQKQAAAQTEAAATYRRLIAVLAAAPEGKLPKADEKALFDAMVITAVTLPDAQRDVATLRAIAAAEKVIAEGKAAIAALPPVIAAIDAIEAEKAEALKKFDQQQYPHLAERQRLLSIAAKSERAEAVRDELRSKNRELLGLVDAETDKSRHHLWSVLYGAPAVDSQYPIIELEAILQNPEIAPWFRTVPSPRFEFLPLPGQSQDELDGLIGIATVAVQSWENGQTRPCRYLLPNEEGVKRYLNLVVSAADSTIAPDPLENAWIPAPGQSLEELQTLLASASKVWHKRKKNASLAYAPNANIIERTSTIEVFTPQRPYTTPPEIFDSEMRRKLKPTIIILSATDNAKSNVAAVSAL